jgi:hypothetical protein
VSYLFGFAFIVLLSVGDDKGVIFWKLKGGTAVMIHEVLSVTVATVHCTCGTVEVMTHDCHE